MEIISHRGYWMSPGEKNTLEAFERSLKNSFGLETDIRDYNEELVISHDIADHKCLGLKSLFSLYSDIKSTVTLALNIKSDGLQKKLRYLLSHYNITNYFVFDMSVPDAIIYGLENIIFFTRQSEYETDLPLYKKADGIWLDCFVSQWYDEKVIFQHLSKQKKVCIVSPELHGRPHGPLWEMLANTASNYNNELMLCTDLPHEAEEFFNGTN